MRILLTGGSGDLGRLLCRALTRQGDSPVVFDLRAPPEGHDFIEGSITDKAALEKAMRGVDMVVHIAALHGIHEETHTAADFQKVNVDGTRHVLDAMLANEVKNLVFISSTSIFSNKGNYSRSKIAAEKMVDDVAQENGLNALTLRPRAFIPSWNRQVYKGYVDWARWFWGGAVHADDVNQAALSAVNYLKVARAPLPVTALTVDGAYDYTAQDLQDWDKDGAGSTFRRVYGAEKEALALRYGLDPAQKPRILDVSETHRMLGYAPVFSLKNLLDELERYGDHGPPGPFDATLRPPPRPVPKAG